MKKKLKKEIEKLEKQIHSSETKHQKLLNDLEKAQTNYNEIEANITNNTIEDENKTDFLDIKMLSEKYQKLSETYQNIKHIELNLTRIKEKNTKKQDEYQTALNFLCNKEAENNEFINRKIDAYQELWKKIKSKEKTENYIIEPDKTSVALISQLMGELNVQNRLFHVMSDTAKKSNKLNTDIKNYLQKLSKIKEKSDKKLSSGNNAYLSTGPGQSDTNKNINKNQSDNNLNNVLDAVSEQSMEIETKAELSYIMESPRFIDKVISCNKVIKPIELKLGKSKNQLLAEPIKIKRPIDYEELIKPIEEKIKNISEKISENEKKGKDFENQIKDIHKKMKKIQKGMVYSNTKIMILTDQINLVKSQIEDLNANSEKSKYFSENFILPVIFDYKPNVTIDTNNSVTGRKYN